MLNVLVVDDEVISVRGIKAGIHWEKIGVTSVFTAYSVKQAKRVFESEQVDILLSDIEMPQEDGLQLLEWVRQHYPETGTVILSCHTDFTYARRALQLGSTDYALKSMTYEELERVIAEAIRKYHAAQDEKKYSSFGQLWYRNKPFLIGQFWAAVVNRRIAPGEEDFKRIAGEGEGDAITPETRILPILFQAVSVLKNGGLETRKLLADAAGKAFGTAGDCFFLSLDDTSSLCILPYEENASRSVEKGIADTRRHLAEACGAELACYIGTAATPGSLADTVDELKSVQRDNVVLQSGIFRLTDRENKKEELDAANISRLADILQHASYESSVREIELYLSRLVDSGKMNAAVLKQFHQDFLQVVYTLMEQKNIQAHLIFSDPFSVSLFEKAPHSVYDTMEWVRHIILRVKDYSAKLEDSLTVIDKVKRYISLHIGEELSCEDIASYVYLNPDYLTRLFKKETGQTVMEYIQNERIDRAKQLMKTTDLSVTRIAEQIGYSNFSHFARMFRRNTGLSPLEYRKAMRDGSAAAN